MRFLIIFFILLSSSIAFAQESEGICLTARQREELKKAIVELDSIHGSKAELEIEPIILIRDWKNRVYINGQEKKPIKAKLTLGSTINRDLEIVLPIQVHYREEPPPDILHLKIRAQFGILTTPLINTFDYSKNIKQTLDAGIGWEFLGLWGMNLSVYTGARSIGGGLGVNLTNNFGIYGGYSLIYDGFRNSMLIQAYFSFN